MRNLIAISALALTVGLSSPASAQYRHHHHHGGGGGWAGPLVGGLIVGGMLGAMASQPRYYYDSAPVVVERPYPRRVCRNEFTHYDYWGRPVVELVCRYE